MLLSDKTDARWDAAPFVVRVSTDSSRPEPFRTKEALVLTEKDQRCIPGFKIYFDLTGSHPQSSPSPHPFVIPLPPSLSYIRDGDILVVRPSTGDLRVLYRKASRHNSAMAVQACNNYCLMCSQPPRNKVADDSVTLLYEAISLMDIGTPELTISGGEPTLLGRGLVELIRRLRNFLPCTAIHVLTNGRLLKYLMFAQDIAEVHHPDLVLGIPLYSDVSHQHDFIVQAHGAFDDTVRGILNVARCELRVELRIVVTKLNYEKLPRIARFIARNFPFSCNVAFMGLELVGFAKSNLNDLWIDPVDYDPFLLSAVRELDCQRIPVSIYNHQLCTLDAQLWQYSRQSISDWKNIFIEECEECSVRDQCCGFFASGSVLHSRAIKRVHRPCDTSTFIPAV